MKNIAHTIIRLRPDRLDIPLQKVTVGLFGSAHLIVVGIPEDVTETRISLTSPSDSAFEVDVGEGGKAYVEPGMLDLAGEGTYHVWATDAHGNPTPLGSGTLTLTREGLTYKGDDKETAYPPYSPPPSSRDSDTLQDGFNLFFPIEKVPSAPFIGGRGNEFYFENCYHELIITDDRRKAVKMLTAVESLYERKPNDKLNSI